MKTEKIARIFQKMQIRKTTFGLAAIVLLLAISLGVVIKNTSVASALTPTWQPLQGFAWSGLNDSASSTTGWISFNAKDCDTDGNGLIEASDNPPVGCSIGSSTSKYFVEVNTTVGDPLYGYASGTAWSSNIGWIGFGVNDVAGCPGGGDCRMKIAADGTVTGWARALCGKDPSKCGVVNTYLKGMKSLSLDTSQRTLVDLDGYSCSVSNSGAVYCWGYNSLGQLGNGGASSVSTPVQVKAGTATGLDANNGYLNNIKEVTTGEDHTCALSNAGSVYCWGNDASGQLGRAVGSGFISTPVQVKAGAATSPDAVGGYLSNIKEVSAGRNHTCAVSNAGSVYCWGYDGYGQTGHGTVTANVYDPVKVIKGAAGALDTNGANLGNIGTISSGANHTCAVSNASSGNVVYCWGEGGSGQRGDNSTVSAVSSPVQVEDGVATGLDTSGVYLKNIKQVSGGNDHTCAVSNASSGNVLYCWGVNDYGELGDNKNSGSRSLTPVQVLKGAADTIDTSGVNLANIKEVSLGAFHTCALANSGSIYCWGYNNHGQIGYGSTGATYVTAGKVEKGVSALSDNDGTYVTNISTVSAGSHHTCAISKSGNTYCWGLNDDGQLGNSQTMASPPYSPTILRTLRGEGSETADGWDGWISLSCANTGTCSTGINYGWKFNWSTGKFETAANGNSYYAWGSDIIGWVGSPALGGVGFVNPPEIIFNSSISAGTATSYTIHLDWTINGANPSSTCTKGGAWAGTIATNALGAASGNIDYLINPKEAISKSYSIQCSGPGGTPPPVWTSPTLPECVDSIDNDGNGKTDGNDRGCYIGFDPAMATANFIFSNKENDSSNPKGQCRDQKDNDGDGKFDDNGGGNSALIDAGCKDGGTSETGKPQCSDGKDNDKDKKCDWNGCTIGGVVLPKDPDCKNDKNGKNEGINIKTF